MVGDGINDVSWSWAKKREEEGWGMGVQGWERSGWFVTTVGILPPGAGKKGVRRVAAAEMTKGTELPGPDDSVDPRVYLK